MKTYEATEQAYKNGYEDGKRDAVKHGRWIERKTYIWDLAVGKETVCSVCEKEAVEIINDDGRYLLSKYCPNCGARMDGDGQ